ncbi:MAG: NGG1p interacting factor NIF3 [Spirochaetales bacterium]|uniref:NGG1p interacting factor NIF3 n=1 Tax=Candidatus Thalassospirochaeta sargassi TaxID=3119039 RepID=A0AAJ1MLN6_9SPIO|nr:NGG1p interacting factor NIF3 [Spirochaetales bacterium]
MYQLIFFVPETHTEEVKKAVFEAGAGKYNDYDSCCWQTSGTGQFRPLENSDAFIGEKGKLEKVTENRVEMLCTDDCLDASISALKEAHPYEEPAYYAVKTII